MLEIVEKCMSELVRVPVIAVQKKMRQIVLYVKEIKYYFHSFR